MHGNMQPFVISTRFFYLTPVVEKLGLSKVEVKGRFLGKHVSFKFILPFRDYKDIKMYTLVD